MYLAGENVCPPEDVCGRPGCMDFIEAMHNHAREAHRTLAVVGAGPFDATAFSISATNIAIRRLH